ncbi:hypothetical protein FWH13_01260 [Candidatus Saccharibacteria bacterium]|nr:hypothetical protein [Candidatus Saccharibacteria bacterium]
MKRMLNLVLCALVTLSLNAWAFETVLACEVETEMTALPQLPPPVKPDEARDVMRTMNSLSLNVTNGGALMNVVLAGVAEDGALILRPVDDLLVVASLDYVTLPHGERVNAGYLAMPRLAPIKIAVGAGWLEDEDVPIAVALVDSTSSFATLDDLTRVRLGRQTIDPSLTFEWLVEQRARVIVSYMDWDGELWVTGVTVDPRDLREMLIPYESDLYIRLRIFGDGEKVEFNGVGRLP